MTCEPRALASTYEAAMLSVARVTAIPQRAVAVNVIAICSRARRKRHKPDSMTTVDPCVERLDGLDELMEPRAMYCARRGHFLRETNAISTFMSRSPFARCLKMKNAADSHARRRQCRPLIDPGVGTKADASHDTCRRPVRSGFRGTEAIDGQHIPICNCYL
jgi:hypothetical protein